MTTRLYQRPCARRKFREGRAPFASTDSLPSDAIDAMSNRELPLTVAIEAYRLSRCQSCATGVPQCPDGHPHEHQVFE
jgi:hypothetical protein